MTHDFGRVDRFYDVVVCEWCGGLNEWMWWAWSPPESRVATWVRCPKKIKLEKEGVHDLEENGVRLFYLVVSK